MQTREEKIAHAFKSFAEHKAELKDLGNMQILNWQKPGTVWYRIRYVFDREGGRIYISGDLGEAVVWPTWPATFETTHNTLCGGTRVVNEGYFLEKVRATSDRYEYDRDEAEKVAAHSTSGGIGITADQVGDLSAGSTSGNIHLALKRFDNAAVSATSGDVTAALPAEPGFTLKHNATSGKMTTDIPLAGSKGSYTCGDGSAKITIGTTSGDLTIRPVK